VIGHCFTLDLVHVDKERKKSREHGGYSYMCTMYLTWELGLHILCVHIISPKVGYALAGVSHGYIFSSHMLVLATNERFLPARDTFRVILASESHWLQPILVLYVHWWPTPACVGRIIFSRPHLNERILVNNVVIILIW
jgi:hypothetical protein